MRHLYVIDIMDGDESDVYFTEMTDREAKEMERFLNDTVSEYKMNKVREDDGFNSYKDLMRTFQGSFGEVE